jgi:hypothetical protein
LRSAAAPIAKFQSIQWMLADTQLYEATSKVQKIVIAADLLKEE